MARDEADHTGSDSALALAEAPAKRPSIAPSPDETETVVSAPEVQPPRRRWLPSAKGFLALFSVMGQGAKDWIATKGIWWVTSVVVHTLILTTALLLMGNVVRQEIHTGVPVFDSGVSTELGEPGGELNSYPPGADDVQVDSAATTAGSDSLSGNTSASGGGSSDGSSNGGSEGAGNPGARGGGHGTVMSGSARGSGPGGTGGGGTGFAGATAGLFGGGTALNDIGGGEGGDGRRKSVVGIVQGGDIGGAVGNVTGSIDARLEKGDLLVVWLMDESISLLEDRQMVAEKIEPYFHNIEARDKKKNFQLFNAVVGFGYRSVELVKPTRFSSQILQSIRTCPIDNTGKENVMSAVQSVIGQYGKTWKGMIIVIWTDESGDDIMMLEKTIEMCKKAHAMVVVVGPSAVLGSDRGTHYWVDKPTGFAFRLPVTRGPETALPEKMLLPYWHDAQLPGWGQDGAQVAAGMPWYGGPHREGLLSGIGPWALTRLALQTGGTFTLLDHKEDQGPFKLSKLKRYFPSYGSLDDYVRSAQSTPLRKAVSAAVQITYQETNMTTPSMAFIVGRSDRYPFQAIDSYIPPAAFRQKIVQSLVTEVDHCKKGLYIIEQALAQFGKGDMEDEYDKEMSPRWRAWYDLNRGRLLAMSIRHKEYILTAQAVMQTLSALKPTTNKIVFHPSRQYRSGPEIEARALESYRLLNRCLMNNADTPWSYLAQWELDHDFGLSVEEIIVPVPLPSSGPPQPTPPTFSFPKL